QQLEVVRGGVPGEAQLLPVLPHDLVDDRRGDAVGAEAADGQVVAVMDEPTDGVGDGGELVGAGAGLGGEEGAGVFGGGVVEEGPVAAGGGHGRCAPVFSVQFSVFSHQPNCTDRPSLLH